MCSRRLPSISTLLACTPRLSSPSALPVCPLRLLLPHLSSQHVPSLRQYIKTPLFVVENQYDTNQLYAQEGVPKKPSGAAQQKQKDDYIKYYTSVLTTTDSIDNDYHSI